MIEGKLHKRKGRREEGIALLMVLSMLVVMSTFVLEFQYTTRVRYQLAASYRDQVQAELLARSGVQIYVLLVLAVNNISRNPMIQPYLQQMGIDSAMILTQLVPALDTGMLRFIGAGMGGAGGAGEGTPTEEGLLDQLLPEEESITSLSREGTGFLDFDGDFSATIEPEDRKINVNKLAKGDFETNPAAIALIALMDDEKYEPLFKQRNMTPAELVGNLRDWIDADGQITAGLGGYEDNWYNRLEDPYTSKNARLSSLSEIHLVEGWDDDMFQLFSPHLTVYGSDKINIASASDEVIAGLLRAYCKPSPSVAQLQQFFLSETWTVEIKPSLALIEPAQMVQLLATNFSLNCQGLEGAIGKETLAYRITSTGTVGEVSKTIEAVVTNKGRLLYWRQN